MAKRTSAARSRPQAPVHEDEHPPARQHAPEAAGPSAAEFAEMRRALVALTGRYNELKEATGGVTLLAPEEVPIYEIGEGGYYSADDVLYPAGIQIEDITGSIIPNEQMIPLNAAAERRMSAYLQSLPRGGGATNHELLLEAAMMIAHTFDAKGRDPVAAKLEFNKLVLDQASRLQMKAAGMLPGEGEPRLAVRPQRTGAVPMMSNTRIRAGDQFGVGQFAAPLARGPVQTRVRAQPLAAAQKAAPPMGTVQNQTLGR